MSCDLENNKSDENDEHKVIFKKLEIGIFILKGDIWKKNDTVKQKVIFEEGVTAKVEKEYDHKRLKIACTK